MHARQKPFSVVNYTPRCLTKNVDNTTDDHDSSIVFKKKHGLKSPFAVLSRKK